MQRFNAAIIGSGNIGTDLMIKALRSASIQPTWMVGVDPDSDGLAKARQAGLKTTAEGVQGLLSNTAADDIHIAFDATSAYAHGENNKALQSRGITVIDLTPAAIGPFCVPPVNLDNLLAQEEPNVNMVTCGGQATIPLIHAVSRVQAVDYAEIVATIASKSAGPGTRKNIDEFTRTTAKGIEVIGGAKQGKAIIILNPAEPPLIMRDTIHLLCAEMPQRDGINESVNRMLEEVQRYVPGYRLKNSIVFDDKRVSIFLEVEGLGDYLPRYAGNLDIMTSAALRTAEVIAERRQRVAG